MSVEISIEYLGNLRCKATHGPSKSTLLTDAPTDNHGKGEMFSPTDLVATALGTCMLTVMGIAAQNFGIDLGRTTVHVTKEMTPPPRRIGKLTVKFKVPSKLTQDQRDKLQRAAMTCPVHKSMHPDVQMPIEFEWG
jgi:putative redox protein